MKASANDIASLMSVERDRLLSLIEFSQQSARLRGKPAATVAAHGLFALYEHEIQGLPGIRINVNGPESEDEIWLAVERLHETKPPDIASAVLRPWVQMTQGPTEEPRLREATDGASLIAAGTHCSSANPTGARQTCYRPRRRRSHSPTTTSLPRSEAQFATYLDHEVAPLGRGREASPQDHPPLLPALHAEAAARGRYCRSAARARLGRRRRHLELRWHHGGLSSGRTAG